MGIIGTCVRRPVLTAVMVVIATILGAISYARMGVRRFPRIEFPVVTILTVYPGGSPSEIETEITKRVEDAVSGLSGIDSITSYSQQGLSSVVVQFNLDQDVDIKAVDVRNQVDNIRNDLPADADAPSVGKFEFSQFPIITLALSGTQSANELYRIADEDLKAMITQVAGVGDVQITGGQRRQVDVLLDARKLRKYRVPIGSVVVALQAANLDLPAGHITQPGREYVIRATGRFQRVEDIEQARVPTSGEGILTVGDLGQVVDTYEEQRTLSRFDGNETVILAITPRSDANEVALAGGVKALLPKLEKMLPPGARLDIAEDTSKFIVGALANVRDNMLIGIALTAAALYLFLKSWRATFIAGVVMPVSVIISFLFMDWAGLSLNIVSLTGMAIVIGVLVNNAILVLENANRFMDEGVEPVEASIRGTHEIAIAIFSSTATNLVVFLPVAFMGEIIGRFFKELGLTVVFVTTVSLLVSYTLTPMMCGLMLHGSRRKPGVGTWLADHSIGLLADGWRATFEWFRGIYVDILHWCLRHWVTTVLLTVLGFAVSIALLLVVGFEFMPKTDEAQFRVTVQAPVGTPLAVTDAAARRIEEYVRKTDYLEHYYARVGQVSGMLGGTSEGVNVAEVAVTVKDRADRPISVEDMTNELRKELADIPSVQIAVSTQQGGPAEAPIAVEISGDDITQLQAIAEKVMDIIRATPGATGISKSWQSGQPEVRVAPIREAANRQGVDIGQVATEVRTYVEGRKATQFRDQDENYDVLVKLRPQDRTWAEDIDRMFIFSPKSARMIRLGQVAELKQEAGASVITRKDRRRLITISAGLTGQYPLSVVKKQVEDAMAGQVSIPEGVTLAFGGEAELVQKNFRELFKAIATATVLTFLLLAGIVESFSLAVIIMLALPACLIGVSLAMLVGDVTVNIFSLMGIIILVGMIINNAIIILDYAVQREKAGMPVREAAVEACSLRFRMNMMTNLTTVVALIPLSLGLGFAGELFRPLAIVQMGGIMAASVLSLLVIPVIHVGLGERRERRRARRLTAENAETAENGKAKA